MQQELSVSYKRIWLIAYPIIIGSIAQNVINVTDTAFLGRLGEVALGGGAIGGLFYLSIVMLGWGFGIGTQIVVARRFGEGAVRAIGRTVEHGLLFLLGLALAILLLVLAFKDDFLRLIISSDEVRYTSIDFVNYRIWGIFFAHANFIFRALYIGIGKTKVITLTTLVMVVINIFLDYSLIFGHFGFPEMGVSGAALASVVAEISCTIVFLVFTYAKLPVNDYRLFRFKLFSSKLLVRLLKVSVPMMFQNFFSFAVWFVFFLLIEKMGESELAVSNIIRSVYVVLLIPIMGFASATNSLVSYVIGKGYQNQVFRVITKTSVISVLGVTAIVAVCSLFPKQLLMVYTTNSHLIELGVPAIRVISVSAVLLALAFVLFSGVSGTGKTNVSLFIEMLVLFLYLILTYVLASVLRAEVHVVWSVEIFYGFFMSLLSYLYLKSGRWKGVSV